LFIAVFLRNLDQAIDGGKALGVLLKFTIILFKPGLGLSAIRSTAVKPLFFLLGNPAHLGFAIHALQASRRVLLHPLAVLGIPLSALGAHLLMLEIERFFAIKFILFGIIFTSVLLLSVLVLLFGSLLRRPLILGLRRRHAHNGKR